MMPHFFYPQEKAFIGTEAQNLSFRQDNPSLTKIKGRKDEEEWRTEFLVRLFTTNKDQNRGPRLACIDEGGSFKFHSGSFSVENPSAFDS
jgi:hypothetical protein